MKNSKNPTFETPEATAKRAKENTAEALKELIVMYERQEKTSIFDAETLERQANALRKYAAEKREAVENCRKKLEALEGEI